MKKSQITIFIILGILILAVIVLGFMFSGKIKSFFNPNEDIESFIDGCNSVAQTCALEWVGENSGGNEFRMGLASIEDSKSAIDTYIENAAVICQNKFIDFSGQTVIAENPKADTSFNLKDTSTRITQMITVKRAEKSIEYDEFNAKTEVKYRQIHAQASQLNEGNQLSISKDYISAKLLEQESYNINIYEANNTQIITITDEDSKIKGTTGYKFSFVKG